jgi:hypothetical protein
VEGKDAGPRPKKKHKDGPKSKLACKNAAPVSGKAAGTCKRRLAYGAFPTPLKGDVPYALSRPELAGVSLGAMVRLIVQTLSWSDVLRPVLAQMDADRPKRGPAPSYSSEELETCLLYQRLAGANTYAEARHLLAGDRGERDRVALGFDCPRKRVGSGLRVVKSLDGVPSEVTVWRHKQRFGLDKHVEAYRKLFEHLVQEHFEEFPELAEEARIVYWDGSLLLSHYTSFERVNRKTGEIKPPTLSGGAYRPRKPDNAGKDGHGFNLVSAVTQTGLPLGARLTPINEPEAKTARGILEDEWQQAVAPYLEDDLVRVMASDAAYTGGHFRRAVHQAGFIPNCHSVSHARRERSTQNAARKSRSRLKIRYRENWYLNGHHELFCECGAGKTMRRGTKKADGEAVGRLEGSCPNCGSVSLSAGEWRLFASTKKKNAVAKVLPDEKDKIDWRIGNPLTYYDPLSAQYGSARFGHQEGFHGALVTRFGLLKEKSWHRDRRQAERDVLQVFCGMHALAMEQRRRAARVASPSAPLSGAGNSGPPPPLSRAA